MENPVARVVSSARLYLRAWDCMNARQLKWLGYALGILWIALVTLAFFVFVPRGASGIDWNAFIDIITLALRHVVFHYILLAIILLCAWTIGARLCVVWKIQFAGALEKTVITIALGIVALSMSAMLLGFLHLLYSPVLWILLLAPIIIWRKLFIGILVEARDAWAVAKLTSIHIVLLMIIAVCILMVCLLPLYPPTSLDAVNAYLTMAKGYLDAGWFDLDPYIKYSMTPNNHTLLFTIAMGLGSGETAVLTHFAMWVLVIAAIAAFGARYLSVSGGLTGALAFALIPVTTVTATWGNAENFVALYAFLSFWAMWRFVHSRKSGDAILAGIFLGFLLGTKIFTGMLWLWLIVAAIIYLAIKGGKFPAKGILFVIAISIVLVLPWFIRNAVYFGNPMFPYFNDKLAGLGGIYQQYETDLQSDIDAGLKNFTAKANDVTLTNFAWEMTFWPNWGSKPAAKNQYRFAERKIHGIGPLFIALLPLLIFVRRKWDVLAGLLIISAMCILTWLYGIGVVYIRYWSFIFPFLMCAAGFAFAETFSLERASLRKPAGFAIAVLIACLSILYFNTGVKPASHPGGFPLRDSTRESIVANEVLGYELIKKLNNMEPEPRVYFLYGATARYYCDFFVIAGYTTPHNYDRFYENAGTGEQLADWLRGIGITHLLVNQKQMRNFGKSLPTDATFAANFGTPEVVDDVALYTIKP